MAYNQRQVTENDIIWRKIPSSVVFFKENNSVVCLLYNNIQLLQNMFVFCTYPVVYKQYFKNWVVEVEIPRQMWREFQLRCLKKQNRNVILNGRIILKWA